MKKGLFPIEFVQSTISHYTFNVSQYSLSLYSVIVFTLFLGIIILPLVSVEIHQKSMGIIVAEHSEVPFFSAVGGYVEQISIVENQDISIGDTLIVLSHGSLTDILNQRKSYALQLTQKIQDYDFLLSETELEKTGILKFVSPEMKRVYKEYFENIELAKRELDNAQKNFDRQQQLFEQEVIPLKEIENDLLKLDKANAKLHITKKQYQNSWQGQRLQLLNELDIVSTEVSSFKEELANHYIVNSVEGNVKNLSVHGVNQYIQPGQKLFDITPNSELYASCYVSPRDIGLLEKGQEVKLSVDAYDFSDWGFITGQIIDISADAYLINSKAYFVVKCALDDNQLRLSNGLTAMLKKGMTFNANFLITRRTLFQLLFDKIDNWYNPNNP